MCCPSLKWATLRHKLPREGMLSNFSSTSVRLKHILKCFAELWYLGFRYVTFILMFYSNNNLRNSGQPEQFLAIISCCIYLWNLLRFNFCPKNLGLYFALWLLQRHCQLMGTQAKKWLRRQILFVITQGNVYHFLVKDNTICPHSSLAIANYFFTPKYLMSSFSTYFRTV